MDFNRYFTNDELEILLHDWRERFSPVVELRNIGSSHENRPIWLVILTDQDYGDHREKPALWLDANIHATEIAGTTTVLHFLHHMLTGVERNDEEICALLRQVTFYIVPRVNPDGALLAMSTPPRYLRSGVRPYPYEDKAEGLHEQDLDGDGRVLQMRIPDPNGDWKISTLDPRIMEKRQPDEEGGRYYRLFPEGILEEYDGYSIKTARPHSGLDFNRNFPHEWRPEGEQVGAGPYPASEPEILALVKFITEHPNINVALTYHTYSGVILRPYGTKSDEQMETDDLRVYKKLGERIKTLTGYKCISVFHDFKYHPKEVITGTFDDWLYDHYGVYAFTVELWDLPGMAGIKDRNFIEWYLDHPHEDDLKIYQWVKENVPDEGYIEWHPYHHPQLGEVELGGWNRMYTWRNPPPQFMGEEAARNTPLVKALGKMVPKLSIHELSCKVVADGVYHINLVVDNTGYFPTYTSAQARRKQAVRPVRVELDPQQCQVVSGFKRKDIGHLEGRSNKVGGFGPIAHSPTDNRARVEWLVSGSPGSAITISIISERAGTIRREIVLG